MSESYFNIHGHRCLAVWRTPFIQDVSLAKKYDYAKAFRLGVQLKDILNGTGITLMKSPDSTLYSVTIHGIQPEEVFKWQRGK